MAIIESTDPKNNPSSFRQRYLTGIRAREFISKAFTTIILSIGGIVILIPLMFMVSTSLKSRNQLRASPPPIIPWETTMQEVNGKEEPLYDVDLDGESVQLALIKNQPGGMGVFVDPTNPEMTYELLIADQKALRHVEMHWENYPEAFTQVPFDRYLVNTLIVTFLGMFGMLISSSLVAYGFSRFRAPGINVLFLILLSTIMLPRQVTLIPVYVFFQKIGWIDTLLPLIVPQFFANAYDVFLLRQFFMTVPLELDDAAKIDGANPIQTFTHVMLPQARPALVAVGIFHFLWSWNDFYEPLIFLHSRENWTVAVGLQTFNALYSVNTHLIMAASVVMVLPPIILFFLAQQIFTQGIVITGI
ncbi:MAG: carbohydrate ABC transporter permease, partial [Anaerolineales bacterium]|nr:carbohydrate ABC transporter permease [Anaerolineales bacterium]